MGRSFHSAWNRRRRGPYGIAIDAIAAYSADHGFGTTMNVTKP
jgi:hypothetical protein